LGALNCSCHDAGRASRRHRRRIERAEPDSAAARARTGGRPDGHAAPSPGIRAAEHTLAARNAAIGQAVAARFPKVSLFGLIGVGGTTLSALGHLDDFSAVAAPELSWNFLDNWQR
jgi:outer membrane protein TolC